MIMNIQPGEKFERVAGRMENLLAETRRIDALPPKSTREGLIARVRSLHKLPASWTDAQVSTWVYQREQAQQAKTTPIMNTAPVAPPPATPAQAAYDAAKASGLVRVHAPGSQHHPSPAPNTPTGLAPEAQAQLEWDTSAQIRYSNFGHERRWKAYRVAELQGLITPASRYAAPAGAITTFPPANYASK